jgi:UDP-N-acetyl-D-mannosaminuronate dehydrogenase
MKFTPGPGLGGHCIPIDPLYLSWKMKSFNYNARFIELASEINTNMPRYVVERIMDALNDKSKALKGSKVLVLGVAYKPDVERCPRIARVGCDRLIAKQRRESEISRPVHSSYPSRERRLAHGQREGYDVVGQRVGRGGHHHESQGV